MTIRNEIQRLLESVDADFEPALSSRISISKYAEKIHKHAVMFSSHEKGVLIGFVALYCNDPKAATAYMTMLAVSRDHRRGGLASNLVKTGIAFLQPLGFKVLRLEVYKTNLGAIDFYEGLNFSAVGETETSIFMETRLSPDQLR